MELVGNHSFSYLELCRLMMVLSDNWATNLLIQALGMENINARAEQLGLEHFEINLMMDFTAVKETETIILLRHGYGCIVTSYI